MQADRGIQTQATNPPSAEWVVFPSELGWMAAAWRRQRLTALTFGHATAEEAVKSLTARFPGELSENTSDGYGELIAWLQAYARGEPTDLSPIDVDLDDLTDFQRRVVTQCRRIPPGETLSYGELAARAGSPKAARAVGNVMANNRLPLVIPCHRVIGSQGALGGFSAPDGLKMKKRLLHLEQTRSPSLDEGQRP